MPKSPWKCFSENHLYHFRAQHDKQQKPSQLTFVVPCKGFFHLQEASSLPLSSFGVNTMNELEYQTQNVCPLITEDEFFHSWPNMTNNRTKHSILLYLFLCSHAANIQGKVVRHIMVKEHRSNIHITFLPYWLHQFIVCEHMHHIFYLIFTQQVDGVICHMSLKSPLIRRQYSNINFL